MSSKATVMLKLNVFMCGLSFLNSKFFITFSKYKLLAIPLSQSLELAREVVLGKRSMNTFFSD